MRHANGISNLAQEGVSVRELESLQKWYVSQADVEMVMFNIGDVHDVNADQTTAVSYTHLGIYGCIYIGTQKKNRRYRNCYYPAFAARNAALEK